MRCGVAGELGRWCSEVVAGWLCFSFSLLGWCWVRMFDVSCQDLGPYFVNDVWTASFLTDDWHSNMVTHAEKETRQLYH